MWKGAHQARSGCRVRSDKAVGFQSRLDRPGTMQELHCAASVGRPSGRCFACPEIGRSGRWFDRQPSPRSVHKGGPGARPGMADACGREFLLPEAAVQWAVAPKCKCSRQTSGFEDKTSGRRSTEPSGVVATARQPPRRRRSPRGEEPKKFR